MNLNDRQRLAVETTEGRLAVIAPPGSGKTRVVVERIRGMLAAGVHASTIAATTFTVRASSEMEDRLDGARLGWVGTIHGLARKILVEFADRHALGADFSLLDTHDVDDLYRAARDEAKLKSPLRTLRRKIAEIHEAGGDPDRLPAEDSTEGIEARVLILAYRAACDRLRAVDFDGLISKCRSLLLTDPEVAASVQRRISHLTVDEGQDVDASQDSLFDLIAPPEMAVPGTGRSTCFVADPCQSIYGWRGGDPRLFLRRLESAHTAVTLGVNYRATKPLVDLANRIAASDPLRPASYEMVSGRD